jgi:adenylosuccinate lyase
VGDVNSHWEVTAEAIQTILRREAVDGAYELLKEETRGEIVTEASIGAFVKKLEVINPQNLEPKAVNPKP